MKSGNTTTGSSSAARLAHLVADIHIRAERQVVSVPFDAGERQQADTFSLFDGLREQVAGQFFPTHRFHPF